MHKNPGDTWSAATLLPGSWPNLPKTMHLNTALSDDDVKVTPLNDEWLSFRVYQDRSRASTGKLAFGVCNFMTHPEGSKPSVPQHFWVILLYRRDAKERWRKLLTKHVITFEIASLRGARAVSCCERVDGLGNRLVMEATGDSTDDATGFVSVILKYSYISFLHYSQMFAGFLSPLSRVVPVIR